MNLALHPTPQPQLLTPFHQWLPLFRTTFITPKGFSQSQKCTVTTASSMQLSSSSSSSHPPSTSLRCAVLGAGFAGLSVAWHLLFHSPKELKVNVDIYDEVGIGGGASGVAGGLVHPYSPKVKLLWRGEECWREFLNLLNAAEAAAAASSYAMDGGPHGEQNTKEFIVRKKIKVMIINFSLLCSDKLMKEATLGWWKGGRNMLGLLSITFKGILRPAVNEKNLDVMLENAMSCLASCPIHTIDENAARELIPNLSTPLNKAFYLPEAVNINPQNYLKALFSASENLVKRMSSLGFQGKDITLHKKGVAALSEMGDEYEAVIVCLGAKVDMLAELAGLLPLRACRGVVSHLQLHDLMCEEYCEYSPSILSDAWLAVQGPKSIYLGSTWEWGSRNYSSAVSSEEASGTLQQLLPKASKVYPPILNWTLTGAQAGVRAMPPLTPQGSFPLLGCIDDFVGYSSCCASKYWLIGGLGARGLLYHGWLGKLTAQAVLSCSEDVLPPELTSWKKIKRK